MGVPRSLDSYASDPRFQHRASRRVGLPLRSANPQRLDQGGKEGSNWEVKDGAIVGTGKASMLYSPKTYKNFKFRAEIKINDHGNSGMYFRCPAQDGSFGKGYEAQIDSTHRDPIRTGSLYTFVHIYKQLVPPDTWFTYEVEVRGQELPRLGGSPHQGLGQRQAALRVPRSQQDVEGGPFRLPAARPGQQGGDPQDRGDGIALKQLAMISCLGAAARADETTAAPGLPPRPRPIDAHARRDATRPFATSSTA